MVVEQRSIHIDFSEFIHEHGRLHASVQFMRQCPLEQSGFSTPQKSSDHINRCHLVAAADMISAGHDVPPR